ncbi:hypothetical protein [Veillonella sp. AS16]|uniref:hypothetical protein n=1 Tax=Veillonella sp. AS16 TaxID=936589 RepID=UPI0003E21C44|nr:hypothetical protein [Veillonella sp. AS16]ETS91732.1 hypothetical protein HMPREF1521_1643 [Veillonella sp. AS16]
MKKMVSYFNLLPLSVKLIFGFTLICVIIISLLTMAAFFNRPNQIQKLQLYEQKLVSISSHKVSEEHYATGRNGQVYNFKITYKNIEFEKVKALLSHERMKCREDKKSYKIGYDLNNDITVKLEENSLDNRVVVVLTTEK